MTPAKTEKSASFTPAIHCAELVVPYSLPFDWSTMLHYFAKRAVPGSEEVADGVYRRTINMGSDHGVLQVSNNGAALVAEFWLPGENLADDAATRVRHMFDLDADLNAVAAHLSRDSMLRESLALHPALRIPGGWDNFEIAIRTILGQQISVTAARNLASRLIDRCGTGFRESSFPSLNRVFPNQQAVVDADLSSMGMPQARCDTLKRIAQACIDDPLLFDRSNETAEETVARLRQIKGVGEWTAQYIAIRACRQADAFPAGDVGLLRGLADDTGARPTPAALLGRAEAWRPYRAYAAHHIWAKDAVDHTNLKATKSGEPAPSGLQGID